MKKHLFSGLLFAAMAFLTFSCGSDAAKVADTAKKPVEAAKSAVTPAKAATAAPTGPTTIMKFDATEFNFGKVDEGEKVTHVFKFTNDGKEPLILSNAKGSCGCTVPQWPKEPIAPGESGEVKVIFNSKNKKGKRNQKVTITANTNPAQSFVYLKGEVTPDPSKVKTPVKK